jgi:hypothetical protein
MTGIRTSLSVTMTLFSTPYTWPTLVEDLKIIPAEDRGWVATRSDYARGYQNIRFRHEGDRDALRHASEASQ